MYVHAALNPSPSTRTSSGTETSRASVVPLPFHTAILLPSTAPSELGSSRFAVRAGVLPFIFVKMRWNIHVLQAGYVPVAMPLSRGKLE